MIWNNKDLKTVRHLMDAMTAIDSEEVAQEFMSLYRAGNPHADENIGYLTGYFDPETMKRTQRLFRVAHPIFGKSLPTPEEASKKGMEMGRAPTFEDARVRNDNNS